jgi:hypothetical protein
LRLPDERRQDEFRGLESNPHVFALNAGVDDCRVEMDKLGDLPHITALPPRFSAGRPSPRRAMSASRPIGDLGALDPKPASNGLGKLRPATDPAVHVARDDLRNGSRQWLTGRQRFHQGVRMVDLTLPDHRRLTFGPVVHRHRAHTKRAHVSAQCHRFK